MSTRRQWGCGRLQSPFGTTPARLIAFATPESTDGQALLHHAASVLPVHIAERSGALPSMPLLPNGKLDRLRLRLPPTDARSVAHGREAFVDWYADDDALCQSSHGSCDTWDAAERAMAALWSELLSLPLHTLRPTDSFIHRGGSSLLLVTLKAKLHATGVSVSIRALAEARTLSAMAD